MSPDAHGVENDPCERRQDERERDPRVHGEVDPGDHLEDVSGEDVEEQGG